MIHLLFAASDNFRIEHLFSIEEFVDNFEDSQSIHLHNDEELEVLLNLMFPQTSLDWQSLNNSPFVKYCNISELKFPELSEMEFEEFYMNWLNKTNRTSDMDEYGNLILFKGLSVPFNKLKTRLLIIEDN